MKNRAGANFVSIASLAILWELAGRILDSVLIPPLSKIGAAWWKLLAGGKLLPNLAASLGTMAAGFVLAALVGIVIGLLMGRFRAVEHFLDLYINSLMSAPTTAFVPVLILWFGLGVESRIAVVFLFAVFVIVINTMTGVKQVDSVLVEMARSFGAKEREVFLKIMLPAAMPAIMAGIRLGMGRAVLGMVTSELILAVVGFGAMLMTFSASYNSPALFATILTIVVLAVALLALIQYLDRRLMPWRV